jgi:hypothetical protein
MDNIMTCYRCGADVAEDSKAKNHFGYLCAKCCFSSVSPEELASLPVPTADEVNAAFKKGQDDRDKATDAMGTTSLSKTRFR